MCTHLSSIDKTDQHQEPPGPRNARCFKTAFKLKKNLRSFSSIKNDQVEAKLTNEVDFCER